MLKDNGDKIYDNGDISSEWDKYCFDYNLYLKSDQTIINKNVKAIERQQIIQMCKNINKKYQRKLTKIERNEFIRKIKRKLNCKFLSDEQIALINGRLLHE